MTTYTALLVRELRTDFLKWRTYRRATNAFPTWEPPPIVEHWIVVEVSPLTNTVIRYWRGTDRDHWHQASERAAVFSSERSARIHSQQFMVDDYYPRATVMQIPV